jgi:hypothetical protein
VLLCVFEERKCHYQIIPISSNSCSSLHAQTGSFSTADAAAAEMTETCGQVSAKRQEPTEKESVPQGEKKKGKYSFPQGEKKKKRKKGKIIFFAG